jgi:hypothetical protein
MLASFHPMAPPILQGWSRKLRNLTSRTNRPWLLASVGLILVFAAWKTNLGTPSSSKPEPDTVTYHYQQWKLHREYLPWSAPGRLFSLNNLRWHVGGKLPGDKRLDKIIYHEKALIRLGYFEERSYSWKGNATDFEKIGNDVHEHAAQSGLEDTWSMSFTHLPGTNIIIIARKQDFPTAVPHLE